MNAITRSVPTELREAQSLSVMLGRLQCAGDVTLSFWTGNITGWYCRVELSASGHTKTEIKSDIKHVSPEAAVEQCLKRVLGAIDQMRKMSQVKI